MRPRCTSKLQRLCLDEVVEPPAALPQPSSRCRQISEQIFSKSISIMKKYHIFVFWPHLLFKEMLNSIKFLEKTLTWDLSYQQAYLTCFRILFTVVCTKVCALVCWHSCTRAMVHVWRPEDSMWESVPLFYLESQKPNSGYQLSRLSIPHISFNLSLLSTIRLDQKLY